MKKEILIFGAGGALGKAAAEVFTKKDYNKIYLFDSSTPDEKFSSNNVQFIQVKDLTDEKNVITAFSCIKPQKDTYYFLFSAVGGFWGGEYIWETKLEDWSRIINLNSTISFLLAKHFSFLVKSSAGGSICLTAAYIGDHPEAMKAAYGTSKSSVIHLIKTLALEGEEINLSANAVSPYVIDTEANRKWMPDSDFSKWIKPNEIAEIVYSIFQNFNTFSGNIVNLKHRFNRGM